MIATHLPLVCTATLESLERDLNGEQALCRNFVCRYVEMWPERFNRIHTAVETGHQEDAMDAILSLRSSCMMVGAARLGELTDHLVQLIKRGSHAEAAQKLPALRLCGNLTAGHLSDSYVNAA